MHPSWISDSYQIWLKGDDVDFEEVRGYLNHRYSMSQPHLRLPWTERRKASITYILRRRYLRFWID